MGPVAQANLDRVPFVQVDRLGPVAPADVRVASDLEHQAREIAAGATLHHRQAGITVVAQVGQECLEDSGVGVGVRSEVDAVRLDVDGAAAIFDF